MSQPGPEPIVTVAKNITLKLTTFLICLGVTFVVGLVIGLIL